MIKLFLTNLVIHLLYWRHYQL